MTNILPLLVVAFTAGCSRPLATGPDGNGVSLGSDGGNVVVLDEMVDVPDDEAAPAPDQAAYLGRWTGVEGMYLVVTTRPAGGIGLTMRWDLDHQGDFAGTVTAEGVRFVRNGVAETAVLTDGDATGLKYLAGKHHCLTVKPGEGYCHG